MVRYSHTRHMAGRIHEALLALYHEDGLTVPMMARLAGCSQSLVYQWLSGQNNPRGDYLFALASRLAHEMGNYRLIRILLPPGTRIVDERSEHVPGPNGSIEDEITDATLVLAEATTAYRGLNPDALAEARHQLRLIERRIEQEELQLRSTRS